MKANSLGSPGMRRRQTIAGPGALLAVVVVLALAGCGGPTPTPTPPTPTNPGASTPSSGEPPVPGVSVRQITRVPELERSAGGRVVISIPVTMKNTDTTSKEVDANLWEVLDSRQTKSGPVGRAGEGKEGREKCEEWAGPGNPTRVTLGPGEEHTFHICFPLADSTDSAKRLILGPGEEIPLQ
jgi:hypothetical protein